MKNKQTKPASLFIILVLVCQLGYSQDYLITFSGSGQSTTIETVEVKNIDQQTTLTLNGTDTLLLTDVVGTGSLPSLNKGMSIYPNPANHTSRLEFYNSSGGSTSIEVYDFSGRLLINKSFHLSVGSHAFSISGLKAGIYLVKVSSPVQTYSQRLVSTSIQGLARELKYEGITQSQQQAPGLKSIGNIVAMQYNDGERLVFKAISGDYAHTKSLIPTENQNIDFEFIDCIDFDGNHYGVVTIGEQVWMAENLKTTHYRNGMPIEYPGTNISAWQNNTTGAYALYYNDIYWKDIYGVLYNWYAVINIYGLCPTGWHVPSDTKWTQLGNYVASQGYPDQWNDPIGAGNALKSCRQMNSPLGGCCDTNEQPRWFEHDTYYGFDAFGFSSVPGGNRKRWGFAYIGEHGFLWSSTERDPFSAFERILSYNYCDFYRSYNIKAMGYSVRCLKD